ncbi:MAG: DUF2059 domain-containing protein [Roseibium sp.]|nr:DUF2059 domain-containing protein [Roseibium sp.]MBO6891089.1 DUF2059 domain-containing protein [Roseibium sp.]MBO6928423.1 DUF2059 domain-containing protein [Roseibium sp.]
MTAGFLSATASAQDISPSHLEAAKKVAAATKVLEPFDDILPILAEQTRTAFIQADPTRAEEIIEVTQNVALQLAAKRSELNDQVYQLWAAGFTEAELNQLAEFYNTELGQKLTNTIPQITATSVGAAREWQDKISTEMVTLVQEELAKGNTAQ